MIERELKKRLRALRDACRAGRDLGAAWAAFAEAARKSAAAPPYYLEVILDALERARKGRPRDEVAILDHGCGGAFKLLYLLALGYTRIYGVDLDDKTPEWNRLTESEFGIPEPRFFAYDGLQLPLPDDSIDFVMSIQVLEHVRPDVLDAYYAEEGRVLKPGGLAFHQVPHRLVPYDSHSRTWFIHYFPRPLARRLYGLADRDGRYLQSFIFLRGPWAHRRRARRYIGPVEDLTVARFRNLRDLEGYDGPKRLRRAPGALARLPAFGAALALLLRNFVMLDTLAVKPGARA